MKPATVRYIAIGLGLALCALIFAADLALPLGLAIWLAYLVLVAAAAWLGDRLSTLILAAVCTVLTVIGFYASPPGIAPGIAAFNRAAGIAMMWGAAFLILDRRGLLSRVTAQAAELKAANEQLQGQAEELTVQAEELAAQAEELQVQAEELRAQNDELKSWSETLEQRIEQRTAALRRANETVRAMSARLIAVQENERLELSHELHDETGTLLTVLLMRLSVLRKAWERGEAPAGAIDEISETAKQLAEQLHRVAVKLRPASLDRVGLAQALEDYIGDYRKYYNLDVTFEARGIRKDGAGRDIENTLYRIVQEALTNVARHAHASRVRVTLYEGYDTLAADVEDDGVGFDVEAARHSGRLGLAGMEERAQLRGGAMSLESRPGGGTRVFVEIPRPASSPASDGETA